MLRFMVWSDRQPRTKKGQPPQSTTGVARANWSHCTECIVSPAGSQEGARSATMASMKSGRDSVVLTQKRRVMSISSSFFSSAATVRGSRAIPHLGQAPGPSRRISGCIGQVYSTRVSAWSGVSGSRAIPHFGQVPGFPSWISGCIGQVYPVPGGTGPAGPGAESR